MKKFFALNNESSEYQLLAKVLVRSAEEYGVHDLHCVYSGSLDAFTAWLQKHNVEVLLSDGQLNHDITATYRGNKSMSHARGAYLRLELPSVLAAHSIMDTWVLYLDVDTMFRPQFKEPNVFPDLVAAAPDFRADNWNFINTGVLVLNLVSLAQVHTEFLHFIRSCAFDFENTGMGPCDQGAWNKFFTGRFEPLAPEYNWKPFWGLNDYAHIVHFVGPNPFEAGDYLVGDKTRLKNHWSETHRRCISKDILAYYTFVSEWHRLAQTALAEEECEMKWRNQRLGEQLKVFESNHFLA